MTSTFGNSYDIFGWRSVTDFGATLDGSTDDTAAVQDCIDHVVSDGGGVVYFPRGGYCNVSYLTFPVYDASFALPPIVITFKGAVGVPMGLATVSAASGSFAPSLATVLRSTSTTHPILGIASGTAFSNIIINIEDVIFEGPNNPTFPIVDIGYATGTHMKGAIFKDGHWGTRDVSTVPSHATGYGCILPRSNGGANCQIISAMAFGCYTGFLAGEHLNAVELQSWACLRGVEISCTDSNHGYVITRYGDFHNQTGIVISGSAVTPRLLVLAWDTEVVTSTNDPTSPSWQRRWTHAGAHDQGYDLDDSGNKLKGYGNITPVEAGLGPITNFVKNGGSNFTATVF